MRAFLACVVAVAAPSFSEAHFLWASLSPDLKTVAIGLQEVPSQAPLPLGDRARQVRAWSNASKRFELTSDSNWLKTPVDGDCVGASLDYGVLDRSAEGRGVFWLKYYAKAASTIEASKQMLRLPVEVTLSEGIDGRPIATVFRNGRPVQGADVVVESAAGDGAVVAEGLTSADGALALPGSSGPFAVRALVTDTVKGSLHGKSYDLVRSYCTLTVASTPVWKTPRPLTRLLRESFGNNHDVVSRTAFINAVMAGTETKAQLEAHLQQRALVHEAVDEVLGAAKLALYGDSQKAVLPLLRHDLESMGSSWPTQADAWPLTRAILKEIRESAKKGPYFALGVFHVYYGGITNGGRDIGAMIADQLKVDETYYLKNDGYREYAVAVDQITDPEAEKEMIRGGGEAYRYIIAINDSDCFKPGKAGS